MHVVLAISTHSLTCKYTFCCGTEPQSQLPASELEQPLFHHGYIKVSVVLPRQDANSAGYVSLPLYALFIFPKQVALYLLQGMVCTCTWGRCSHCCTTSPFKTPLAYLACCTPFSSTFILLLTNLSMVTARTHSTAGRNQIPQGSRGGERWKITYKTRVHPVVVAFLCDLMMQ